MNLLDLFFLTSLISGFIWGFKSGFIKAVVGMVAIGIALFIGMRISVFFEGFVDSFGYFPPDLVPLISIMLAVILVYMAVNLLGRIMSKITHIMGLGIFNRIAGGLLGVVLNAMLLSSLIFYLIPFVPSEFAETLDGSKIFPLLNAVGEFLNPEFDKVQNRIQAQIDFPQFAESF